MLSSKIHQDKMLLGYCRNLRSNLCPCFVCGKKFSLDNGVEDLLTHICFTHRIIIENIERIADFKGYVPESHSEELPDCAITILFFQVHGILRKTSSRIVSGIVYEISYNRNSRKRFGTERTEVFFVGKFARR